MGDTVTIGGAANQTFLTLGDVLFRWIPGVVTSLTDTGPAASAFPWQQGPITAAVTPGQVVDYVNATASADLYEQLSASWYGFVLFSLLLSLLLAALIVYCQLRVRQIRAAEERHFNAAVRPVAAQSVSRVLLRWRRIVEQASGEDEQGWRLAILESDILLNELLDTLGYRGETMADKMRAVERGDFRTIDLAWEAHRARNRVAHEGSAHALSQRDTLRIVGLYEQVFREFQFLA